MIIIAVTGGSLRQKDNQLKPVHYLVKHEEIKYKQKNDCHPILADYGDDQFSICIKNKGEDIHIKPLVSFSFQSIVPFESKYKKPTKNQAKSLLQQSQQNQDTVLQKVYQWILNRERPLQIDPTIAANSFLLVYYKIFNQLYINHDTKIIHIEYPNLHDSNPNQRDKICLPFKLFHAAFNKLHAHGHSGIKISIKAFNQFYFIPYLNKLMSIFIHDCIECQQNKHINQKLQTASIQTFSENASYFNYRISMDTKGPINPPSNQNSYIHVIVDAFSHFVVTVPIKQNNAETLLTHYYIIG